MPTLIKSQSAIELLKADHKKVKALFDQFEEASDKKAKKKIVEEALNELKVHAAIEEEIFYPAVRHELEDKEGLMDEADEEHHVAKVLIAELELMSGDEEHYDAKFTVLAENVRHHIKEEEGETLPKAKRTDIDFDVLGEQMADRKQELMSSGVPADAEMKMVQKSGLRGDSPAQNAERSFEVPKKSAKGERHGK